MKIKLVLFALAFCIMASSPVMAAGGGEKPPHQDWSFNGMAGTYDRAALQRGFKVYKNVCSACHGMKYLHYRNLEALGYNENQIKNIAAEYTIIDGPNDEGDMFERPGIPADKFWAPYANNKQAAAANGGALPPDLSLITKARVNGVDYLYALLTGYKEAPEGKVLLPGQYYNKYMPGNIIAMAPPLSDGVVGYEDGTPETVEQYAKDITYFLTWSADPYMEERKRMGIMVLLFLLAFAGVMYGVKKKIWADLH